MSANPSKLNTRTWRALLLRWTVRAAAALLCFEFVLRGAGAYMQSRFLAGQRVEDGDVVVLALGESTTRGIWVDAHERYPHQLEGLLRAHYKTDRIRVIVPVHIGQNTSQIGAQLEGYLSRFRPALVILMTGANNGWSLSESNLGNFMPPGTWQTYLFRIRRVTDNIKIVRLFRILTAGYDTGQLGTLVSAEFEGRPRYTKWPPKPDWLVQSIGQEPFMRLYRSDVGGMIDAARQAGARVLMMTYPVQAAPPREEVDALASGRGVPLVDNSAAFDVFIRDGRTADVLFWDFFHPTPRGYTLVAENAFRAIVDGDLLGRVTPP